MPDIDAPTTPEVIALGQEAKRIIESEAMQEVFKTLRESYIRAWEGSEMDSKGEIRDLGEATAYRGTMWVKVKCLEDLQFELKSYANRAEFAENGRNS